MGVHGRFGDRQRRNGLLRVNTAHSDGVESTAYHKTKNWSYCHFLDRTCVSLLPTEWYIIHANDR